MDLEDLACSRGKHRGIQGKIRSMRLHTKRRHRLQRDICSQWELRHMIGRITLEEISTQNGPPKNN